MFVHSKRLQPKVTFVYANSRNQSRTEKKKIESQNRLFKKVASTDCLKTIVSKALVTLSAIFISKSFISTLQIVLKYSLSKGWEHNGSIYQQIFVNVQ